MKKNKILNFDAFVILILLIISLLIFSCQTPNSGGGNRHSSRHNNRNSNEIRSFTMGITFITRDKATVIKNIQNLPMNMINKVYFRSSDIEFWAINNINDIDNIISTKYVDYGEIIPENLQKSVFVGLPNANETFVFIPGQPSGFTPESKPTFEKKKYNLIRLDIGGGPISFMINNELKEILNSDGVPSDSGEYLDCNSIFFVDEEYLDHNIYITRNEARAIENGATSGIAVIDSILRNSNYHDTKENGMIDVDGALFISFNAIDFNDYESIENITVDVSWDMNNLLTYNDNNTPLDYTDDYDYRMQDRVEKTCYDFNVDLIIK